MVLGDSHSVLFLFLPPIYGLPSVRGSIEDQMGILLLISGKSGASVFLSASTEERVTDGVYAAG